MNKLQQVTFRCGALALEGELATPANATRGAVVCHPHPQYGGSMHNNVVEAVVEGLLKAGIATLRFNFRGVGGSQGNFDNGIGEAQDVAAAVVLVGSQAGIKADAIVLAGYSFGAMVAIRAGTAIAAVKSIIAVAPPLSVMDSSMLSSCNKPLSMIAGDRDPYCSEAALKKLHFTLSAPGALEILAGGDHVLLGYEQKLSAIVEEICAG